MRLFCVQVEAFIIPKTRANTSKGEGVPAARAPVRGRGRGRDEVKGRSRVREATPTRGRDREASLEPIDEHDDVIEQQTEVRDPARPPSVPDSTLMLHELIVRLLVRLDSVSPSNVLLGTSGYPITNGATRLVLGPSVGFQTLGPSSVSSIASSRFTSPHISSSATVCFRDSRLVSIYDPRCGISLLGLFGSE
ncbi:hypothetical protein KY285_000347 [Solanum tuberosum]|nr:hypothetical protein KY285_000347 [Solanum tuberosum]